MVEDENNIYEKRARIEMIEDDELTLKEVAFMDGYDDAEFS
jgi:hypothetical protein